MMSSQLLRVACASVLLAACGGGSADDGGDGDSDAGSDGRTVDAAIDATPVTCTQLNPVPISPTTITGFSGSEDFAFDATGNLISTDSSGNLTRQGKTGGRTLIMPNLGETAGTAFLSNGDLVIANVGLGAVERITTAGSRSTLLPNIAYPNGVAVGPGDMVYVAEHDAGRVLEVNPATGASRPIAINLTNPNGLSFSPDYRQLYVGSFGGGTVHRIESDGSGGWRTPALHGNVTSGGFEGGGLDGIAVDACGNVYATEYILGKIWRLPPTGGEPVLVTTLPSTWIPNMHWGAGVGDWSRDILYVMDREQGRVFELDLGVTEKATIYP